MLSVLDWGGGTQQVGTLDFALSGNIHWPDWIYQLVAQQTTEYCRKVAQGQGKGYCSGLWRHRYLPVSASYAPAENEEWDQKMVQESCSLKCPLFVSNLHTANAQGQGWLETHLGMSGPFAQYDLGHVELKLFMFFFRLEPARNP